ACPQFETVFCPATGRARTPTGSAGSNVSPRGSECVAGRRSVRGELPVPPHRENCHASPARTHAVRKTSTSRRIVPHRPAANHELLLRRPRESCLLLVS